MLTFLVDRVYRVVAKSCEVGLGIQFSDSLYCLRFIFPKDPLCRVLEKSREVTLGLQLSDFLYCL